MYQKKVRESKFLGVGGVLGIRQIDSQQPLWMYVFQYEYISFTKTLYIINMYTNIEKNLEEIYLC
jgi:hypothetical protein